MKFEDCVMACFANREFMTEYNRLAGSHLGQPKPPASAIEALVDQAAGFDPSAIDEDEAIEFFQFVRDFIWIPVVLMEQDASENWPKS
jgi:hypothetical protein